ncbi:MAG TPA: membrane protein insertase YidC [Chitinophagaceae bacterium]|nr:membrane protein insertase YidC [Chitinophagaceae bacterium]
MSMDRNTVIGFVLLAVLLFLYLFLSTKGSNEVQQQQQAYADSVAKVKAKQDSIRAKRDSAAFSKVPDTGSGFQKAAYGPEQLVTVENNLMKVAFTSKGGQPKSITLKKYTSYKNGPVVLLNTPFDRLSYTINTETNTPAQTGDLNFEPAGVQTNADGSQTVRFRLAGIDGRSIVHQYTVRPDVYLIDWNIQMAAADRMLTQGTVNLLWQNQPTQHEKDIAYERQQSQIGFYEGGDYDWIFSKAQRKFEEPVNWVSIKQQFFNSTIIAKNNFKGGQVEWIQLSSDDTTSVVTKATANLQMSITPSSNANFEMQLYYGPNDYAILKNTAPDLDKMVNLGQGFYTFVRPINKYIVMPVFNFFKDFITSFGIVIALLTIFIRLLTSPLVYRSYLSGAKMKALRPEIDKLKQQYGGDQQQMGMEQMKLFREAGVNPLGGCIPALLQIPIFFALYSFFNSSLDLRGVPFLWAEDLSAYDSILNFGFRIPLLGSHLSLFTLTAVITSFLISIYNMNMTPDQSNPALKYMPYIFPFILLFIFNSLPSALTWYYTVSNVITLALQWVIQNYIIDHDKILAKLEANRKKPKTKSKWQERFEQMQEAQKKAQQTQQQQRNQGQQKHGKK